MTKSNSIEQITKLQDYKKEQSTNSFYKEFKDEESFKTLALQEMSLWLRSLIATENQTVILDGGDIGESKDSDGEGKVNQKAEVVPYQGDKAQGLINTEEHTEL